MTKEYVIIDKALLEKRIEELERWNYIEEKATTFKSPVHYEHSRRMIIQNQEIVLELKKVLSQSTPLLPEIEKAFNAGSERGEHGYGNANNKQDYISNLKLNI